MLCLVIYLSFWLAAGGGAVEESGIGKRSSWPTAVFEEEEGTELIQPNTTSVQLSALFERQPLVRRVLDANDELRAMGLGSRFDFPSMVVIGDQSAGKSSVLEAISGVQLLRGAGVVTRAPIELRLIDAEHTDCQAVIEENAYSSTKGKQQQSTRILGATKAIACSEVAAELNVTMRQRLARGKQFLLETPIRVRVSAKGLPDLTLIDLPGLARVATQGQDAGVPAVTRKLAASYAARPNTIILAVVPCNADLATAEALKLATEADPNGERTIGILTKPDLMDPGTENVITKILDGQVIQLATHGWFVVRNRGQRDIDRHVDLDKALAEESRFFNQHQVFSIAKREHSSRFGVPALVHYLTQLLVRKIVQHVPKLKRTVEERILAEHSALEALGGPSKLDYPQDRDKKALLLGLTTEYSLAVRETTRGHYDLISRDSKDRGLMADLLQLYREFNEDIRRSASPEVDAPAYESMVKAAVAAHHGREAFYGFPSYAIFTTLVQEIVHSFTAPAMGCAAQVRARVIQMSRSASTDLFAARYPKLKRTLDDIARSLAEEKYTEAKAALDIFLAMQMQPFTQELLLRGGGGGGASFPKMSNRGSASSNPMPPPLPSQQQYYSESEQSSGTPQPREAIPSIEEDDPAISMGRFFGRGTGESFRPQSTNRRPHSTDSRSFQNGDSGGQPRPSWRPPRQDQDVDAYAVHFIKSKIQKYSEILAQRVGDLVPMAIDMYLVQRFGHELALRIANATHALSDRQIDALLAQSKPLANKRTAIEAMLNKLNMARELLDDFACGWGGHQEFFILDDSYFESVFDDEEDDDDTFYMLPTDETSSTSSSPQDLDRDDALVVQHTSFVAAAAA